MKRFSSPAVGRPREFDPEVALERALQVFWRRGFDATSVTDLTKAMGINPPSLYAAFGNKRELFRKAVALYLERAAAFLAETLEAPTAREVAARRLHGAIDRARDPQRPPGCLAVQTAVSGGEGAEELRGELAGFCRDSQAALEQRFGRARAEGDLPADADPVALARFVTTLGQGIAVQATSGVSLEDLRRGVDAALAGWPKGRGRRERRG